MKDMKARKIKVLQFASSADIGGTERMLLELVTRMDPRRFASEVCFLYGPGPIGEELRRRGFRIYYLHFKGYNLPVVILRLILLLIRNKYDLIHIYGLKANLLTRILCWFWGPKRLITGQRSTDENRRLIHSWLDRVTAKRVTLFIANAAAAKKVLVERERIPAEKIAVVPNGVDCQRYRPPSPAEKAAARAWLGLQPATTVMVCVANLLPVKGHRYLLRAVAALPLDIREKLTLLLVGYGPLRVTLEKEVETLNLGGAVRFLGKRDSAEVAKILQTADIFVLASLWEGLPNAVLEAMATGLPVIATRVGGIPELIRHGENGILVPPQDVSALSQAMVRLIQDNEWCRLLGSNARKKALSSFSLEEMTARIEKIYMSLF